MRHIYQNKIMKKKYIYVNTGKNNKQGEIMLLLIVLLFLIICFLFLVLGILLASIKLQVNEFRYDSKDSLSPVYDIKVIFYLYGFVKFFALRVDNKNVYIDGIRITKEKLQQSKPYQTLIAKLDQMDKIKFVQKGLKDPFRLKLIKNIRFQIQEWKSFIEIGTFDIMVTTFLVTALSVLFPIFIRQGIKEFKRSEHQYQIVANYSLTNMICFKIHCIINVKIAHIIHIIYQTKRRSVSKNGRTSNRRINENCNE